MFKKFRNSEPKEIIPVFTGQETGGFFTRIDKLGNAIGTNKHMLTQTRNIYGMVRAYMLTGDTTYINLAGEALNWMYAHAWDITNGGWIQELERLKQDGRSRACRNRYMINLVGGVNGNGFIESRF